MTLATAAPLPWYQSRAVWGGIVSILAGGAGIAGLSLTDVEMAQAADVLTALASAIGGALAVYGRIRARRKIGVPS